mgnify:CR=1 FL=1
MISIDVINLNDNANRYYSYKEYESMYSIVVKIHKIADCIYIQINDFIEIRERQASSVFA